MDVFHGVQAIWPEGCRVSPKRKACAKPGCPTVHTEAGSYCKEHRQAPDRSDIQSRHERGYTNDWAAEAKQYLRKHRWCVCAECTASGNPRRANCVDHRVAHKGNTRLFWDRSNWQALNNRCHGSKTVREDGGFGR